MPELAKSDNKKGTPPKDTSSYDELLKEIISGNVDIKKVLNKLTDILVHSSTSPQQSTQYYNKDQQTITRAGPNPPAGTNYNPNDPVYSNSELIYDSLQPHRRAPRIQIINDSTDTITDKTIYVISSSNGSDWTPEATLRIGEARSFYNVWELRLRSPTAGVPYRVTEWDIWLPYSRPIAAGIINLNLFTGLNVPAPFGGAGINLPAIVIPNSFSLSVKANVNNLGQVFLAGPIPVAGGLTPQADAVTNVGIAANRITLDPGDTVELYISNSNLVAILGSAVGNSVDILVEQ
jgi:hypothetical protein